VCWCGGSRSVRRLGGLLPQSVWHGRIWTYNLWGCDCVKLTLERKPVRIGSDDAKSLAKFLGERTGLSALAE
jgi:hypothetical protein